MGKSGAQKRVRSGVPLCRAGGILCVVLSTAGQKLMASRYTTGFRGRLFGRHSSSMHRLLTRLLLWLVVLALPLQGMAATAMMARAGTLDEATVAMAMPVHDGAAMADACHEHEEAMAADGDAKAPTQSHCKTCPICAACSLGSVIPLAASLGVPLLKLPADAPRELSTAFHSFIPEALQRPPSIRV
jgi:hypothetical protein